MNMIKANYINELKKLSVKKKYIVFLIIALVICFFKIGVSWAIRVISEGNITLRSSNLSIMMLSFFAELYVPLVAFMAITDLFSTEFHDYTIKAELMRPISRWKIILSKHLAAVTVCAVYYIAVFLFCTILEFVFGTPSAGRIFASLASYVLDIIPLAILALMTVLINMITRSATFSMFLSIIVYALFKMVYIFGNAFGSMLFSSYMQWHKLWVGVTLPLPALLMKIGILAGWTIIMYTVSYMLFERKEF